jgi:hypothetical protein
MPHFLFHLLDDFGFDYVEGRELPDNAAAREQAQRLAIDMASASILQHRKFNPHHSIRVAGEGGVLMEVKLGEAFSVRQ